MLWFGWLQQADPVIASEQRKKWQRSLASQFPLLADLLSQWAGDRHGQAVGLFDTLQLPAEGLAELHRTLDAIPELPWHSQVEGLSSNA